MSDLVRVLALPALVAGNAFFVVAEYAVVTARRAVLAERAERGSKGARAALRLMREPVRVISTVQVGITAIGILTGAIGEPLVREALGGGVPGWLGFLIAFTAITYVTVVLGELVPKALTLDRAETLAILVAPPIELLSAALRPVVWLLEVSARGRAAALRGRRGGRGRRPCARRRSCARWSTRPRAPASSRARRRSCCTTCSTSRAARRAT